MAVFSYTLFCSLFISLGGFLYAYDSGVISPAMVQPTFVAKFNDPTPEEKGAIVACFAVGALLGSLGVGFVADRLGRRRTIALGSCIAIFGAVLMTGARDLAMLILGRLFIGVGVGLMTSTAPVYAAEIAKMEERGRVSAAQQLMLAFGFLIANWTGYGFKRYVGNDVQWRGPFAIQIVPGFVLLAGLFFIPESPRWLMLKGREEQAKAALMRFHFNGSNQDFIDSEFNEIREKINAERLVIKIGWLSAISTPSRRHRLAIGSGVWVFAMLSGISFIQYFQPTIYKTLGFSLNKQLLVTGLYGSMAPIFVTLNLFIVDRVGRKVLLTFAGFSICILYTIITCMAAIYPATAKPVNEAAQYVVVACVFAISCVFSCTLGPLGWVIPPEVFPSSLRGVGNSMVHVAHYSFSILVSQASPVGLARIGWRYYIVFIIFNAISGFVFLFCYPETRGKTLEEIDAIFGDDPVEQVHAGQQQTLNRSDSDMSQKESSGKKENISSV